MRKEINFKKHNIKSLETGKENYTMKLLRRMLLLTIGVILIFARISIAQTVTGIRDLPVMYGPGGGVDVSIAVDVDEANAPNGVIVNEYIPAGWTVNTTNPDPDSTSDGKISWLFYDSVTDTTITYSLSVPANESGMINFNGEIKYIKDDAEITETIKGDTATEEAAGCVPTENSEATCDDGLDNDCDGAADNANNQLNVETTVEFKWNKCSDADGNALTYDLYICEDNTMTTGCMNKENIASLGNIRVYYAGMGAGLFLFGIVFAGGMSNRKKMALLLAMMIIVMLSVSCGSSGGGDGNGDNPPPSNEIVQVVSGLKANTVYYWKVIVDDGNGGTVESSVRSFTTK